MAKKKYKLSELGELGELVKNYKEKNSKKKETDSNNASIALSNSSSVQRYHNLGESLNNYLQNLQKSSGIISKNDYVNALNAQRKAIGAEVKSAVNSATSSRLPSEINASEREAIAETTKIARFKKSEREEAAKRAKLNLKRQTSPVVNDLRHHRTIHSLCFGGTLACIFSVMCHKPRQQRICSCFLSLFNLTKNLSAQLYHQNCAVVP